MDMVINRRKSFGPDPNGPKVFFVPDLGGEGTDRAV